MAQVRSMPDNTGGLLIQPHANQVLDLGVFIDSLSKSSIQVPKTVSKVRQRLAKVNRTFVQLTIYSVIVHSHLKYCVQIWSLCIIG